MENQILTTGNKSTYYYSNNKRIPLARESSVYAVKFVTGRDPRDGSLSRTAFRLLNEQSEDIGFIPNYNFRIFKKEGGELKDGLLSTAEAISREVENLKVEPSIEFATMAYRRNPTVPAKRLDDLMFSTREFVVQYKSGLSQSQIEQFNQRNQVEIQRSVDYVENGFVLLAPEADGEKGPVVLSNIYYESGMAQFAHPNFVQRKHIRSVIEKTKPAKLGFAAKTHVKNGAIRRDDYLSRQWHLEMARITEAWTITRGNSNVKVAILDDGVDISHPEFADKVVSQFDFATGAADGVPKHAADNHGTACAGVAIARGVKAFGAAPECSLIVANTPGFMGSVEEGDMFKWVCDQGADIISCSWGPKDGTGAVDTLADNVRAAINYCVTQGRGGLGTCVFWAAGNGNESVSNDGYASNPDVIAVAASSSNETRSWYSDFGPEVFICAPSSGDYALGELGVFTVDRQGNDGYNPDKKNGTSHPADDLNYTDSFGGTSSATPLSAGIAALMLSINPKLKVDEIKSILMKTAAKIDTEGGAYDENGHSNFYGYGRIDARAAVEIARDYLGTDDGGNISELPAISTVAELSRAGEPPIFEIEKGGRALYAVEIANEAELFNTSIRGNDRNENNFFASWTSALEQAVPYTLPANSWELLKDSERLFYRVLVADDNNWSNYSISTGDDMYNDAPYLDIKENTSDGGVDDGGTSPELSIIGPTSVFRDSEGPTFEINLGGRQMYAVEVATDASLFESSVNEALRNSSNFYASWDEGLISDLPFLMPSNAWNNLKVADHLYYRLHVADDNSWGNYDVSLPDNEALNAPSMKVVSGSRFLKNIITIKSELDIMPYILAEAKNEDELLWHA